MVVSKDIISMIILLFSKSGSPTLKPGRVEARKCIANRLIPWLPRKEKVFFASPLNLNKFVFIAKIVYLNYNVKAICWKLN